MLQQHTFTVNTLIMQCVMYKEMSEYWFVCCQLTVLQHEACVIIGDKLNPSNVVYDVVKVT